MGSPIVIHRPPSETGGHLVTIWGQTVVESLAGRTGPGVRCDCP
ncbi:MULTISPECIES: hypothetical protein [Streptomyces]|nr:MULTISPECIES: hypothetical protein [unclassified Streptomyces]